MCVIPEELIRVVVKNYENHDDLKRLHVYPWTRITKQKKRRNKKQHPWQLVVS